jgi:non-lysosomal glucosylceramidase
VWQTPTNGFGFDAPEAWHENTTSLYRYRAYARALSVWDDIESIKPLHPIPQAP